ncbi:MAG: DivIVA domain protein [Actinotalea sp.]|jgi:DivIVA domain-containing protein|nr:DivIVA domain protein [Actinotalea sp.]
MTAAELRAAHAGLTTTSVREGYEAAEVDDLLDRAAQALAEHASGRPAGLTSQDVLGSMFHATALRPGYDQDEVDDLLDAVAEALDR